MAVAVVHINKLKIVIPQVVVAKPKIINGVAGVHAVKHVAVERKLKPYIKEVQLIKM